MWPRRAFHLPASVTRFPWPGAAVATLRPDCRNPSLYGPPPLLGTRGWAGHGVSQPVSSLPLDGSLRRSGRRKWSS